LWSITIPEDHTWESISKHQWKWSEAID